jgi:hypothetical protein
MNNLRSTSSFLAQFSSSAAIVLLLATGCTRIPIDAGMRQYFDESNGATVTRLAAPLAFYSEEPMLASNARDYIYIGPAELNRSGDRKLILWANFCSTIDRPRRADRYEPDRVFLMLDGKPMELSPANVRMGANEWSYVSPVVGGSTRVYRVTRAQLRLLAGARDIRILAEQSGATREYTWWRGAETGFRHFAGYLDDESQYLVTSIDE